MRQLLKKFNTIIPSYVIFPLIFVFISQSTIYFGTKLVNANMKHYDLTISLDSIVPILPSFAIIYLGCYIFWVINYALVGRISKEYFYRFVTNIFLGYIISGLIFCIFPTYIERPAIETFQGIGTSLVKYVYISDTPVNLFPSMHCLISWYCYIGLRGKKEFPIWYRLFSFILAILVCISTVVIRQHFLLDIVAGIVIAEFTYFIAMRTNLYKPVYHFFERINARLHLN